MGRRTLLEQIELDRIAYAKMHPATREMYRRELAALFRNAPDTPRD